MYFKRIALLTCFLFFGINSQAFQDNNLEYNLSTPRNTMQTHINYLQEDNYHPEIAAKAINPKYVSSQEEAKTLAIKLLQVYRAEGILIDFGDMPNETNHVDSVSKKSIYRISSSLPDVYLQKDGNRWYYSKKTIQSIGQLHKSVYPFGVDKLMTLLPKMGGHKIMGLHLWQYFGILFIIILCVVIHKVFTVLITGLIFKVLERLKDADEAKKFVKKVARPTSVLVLYPFLLVLVPVLQLPLKLNGFIVMALKFTWPLFATIVAYRMVDLLVIHMQRFAERTESTLDDQLVPLVSKTLRLFVIIIGILVALANLNINIIPLLTGLSIGGLAFALAAQDTLKNLFGSVMIFLDKPFQVGDWITSGDIDGTVEEVGFRSTRVRTFRDSVTYVPNALIADTTVDNHGLRKYRRFYTKISLTYDTPTALIEAYVEGLRKIVEMHPKTRKDFYNIYFNEMGSHSLNIMFYIFFHVPTWTEELRCRHEVLVSIMKLAESLGVNFAFPTQTLHMETFPGQVPNSPSYIHDTTEIKARLDEFEHNLKSLENGKQK